MKNQYLGDVNDYRKYGVLRCFALAGFRSTLCWMLTADDGGRDGQKRTYLENAVRWRGHDPELFDALGCLMGRPKPPTVHDVCRLDLIPSAKGFAELLEDTAAQREAFFDELRANLRGDLAFFDPDNGVEIKSVRRGGRSSSKYVYWSELEQVYDAGLSLLVYQHLPRRPRQDVAMELVAEASRRMPGSSARCLSAGAVLYLAVIRPEHVSRADAAYAAIAQRWHPAVEALTASSPAASPQDPDPASPTSSLGLLRVSPKTGDEVFHANGTALDRSLRDLWSWSCSDLVSNTYRGVVAEYLVAMALGVAHGSRSAWDAFDLETPEGIRVEVKSAAYVQTWHQNSHSRIDFAIPPTRAWNAATNLWNSEIQRQADVYVFCLLANKDTATLDPMDVTQWRFFVLARSVLDETFGSQTRASLSVLEKAGAREATFDGLPEEVSCAMRQEA